MSEKKLFKQQKEKEFIVSMWRKLEEIETIEVSNVRKLSNLKWTNSKKKILFDRKSINPSYMVIIVFFVLDCVLRIR